MEAPKPSIPAYYIESGALCKEEYRKNTMTETPRKCRAAAPAMRNTQAGQFSLFTRSGMWYTADEAPNATRKAPRRGSRGREFRVSPVATFRAERALSPQSPPGRARRRETPRRGSRGGDCKAPLVASADAKHLLKNNPCRGPKGCRGRSESPLLASADAKHLLKTIHAEGRRGAGGDRKAPCSRPQTRNPCSHQ